MPSVPPASATPMALDTIDNFELSGLASVRTHEAEGKRPAADTEHVVVNRFVHDQLKIVREARETWRIEKRSEERALEARRQELEQQARVLASQDEKMRQRERLLAEREKVLREGSPASSENAGEATDLRSDVAADQSQTWEIGVLRQEVQEQQQDLQRLWAERATMIEEFHVLRKRLEEQGQEVRQLRTERDAAQAQLRQPPPEPPDWSHYEQEFAILHRQIEKEKRLLAEESQQLRLHAAELQRQHEQWQHESSQKQCQLEQLSAQCGLREKQLQEAEQCFKEQEQELRLRDAELRELVEMAERDNARQRGELVQEAVRLARLRESLRIEQEAWRVERERSTQMIPASGLQLE